jgi:hypothetical protein
MSVKSDFHNMYGESGEVNASYAINALESLTTAGSDIPWGLANDIKSILYINCVIL